MMVNKFQNVIRQLLTFGFMSSLVLSHFAGTAEADELRYDFKPDEVVAYKFNITAQEPNSSVTMTGVVAYTGKQASQETVSLTFVGNLNRITKSKTSSRGRSGFRPGGPPRGPGFPWSNSMSGLSRTTNQLVVSRLGGIRKLTGESQLPYLLGNLSILPFETLPANNQREWKVDNGFQVVEGKNNAFFGGPFRNQQDVRHGGSEMTSYRITNETEKMTTISKTYTLNSPAAEKDDYATSISGNGTFVFNKELGLPESLQMKQSYVMTRQNSTVTIPMTVNWTRVPKATWDAQEKSRADRIAALKKQTDERNARNAAAAKAAAGKKLDSKKKTEILADLNSSQWPNISRRLRNMSRFHPHPDDFDIALRVKELQKHKVIGVSMTAKKLWLKLEPIVNASPAKMASGGSDNPFATEDEKTAVDEAYRKMRTWTDTTGAFKIEAEFEKFDGDGIVLKRKDGKQITVPLAKLGAEDRKIADLLRAAEKKSPAAENPFQ